MKSTRYIFTFFLLISILISCGNQINNEHEQERSARGVISRVTPQIKDLFILKFVEKKEGENDYFEIEGNGKHILIKGTSANTICAGYNFYLKKFCNSRYTWRGENLNIPDQPPLKFDKIRRATVHKYRLCFNYCTFGYSTAFWGWDQWEKMIDWMAMNGINMPLAITGQEVIWQRVFEKYGLTKDELKDFLSDLLIILGEGWVILTVGEDSFLKVGLTKKKSFSTRYYKGRDL